MTTGPAPARPIMVRVGIPKTGGQLVAAARDLGYPVLFSANAFAKVYGPKHERAGFFKGFSKPDALQYRGLDAALDSAGFVAAVKYGDYRWTVDDYVHLAASHPWAWWASMDYCCEKEVSGDRQLRMLRIAATAQLFGSCSRAADERGIGRPMPVIQGWHAHEYAQCIDWLPVAGDAWPGIVGVGSVCRRQLDGEHGILNIVATLDRLLPAHVKLHLFGVKSGTLAALGPHPRIASMDSMAWDFRARMERRTGRDMRFRIDCMAAWAEQQRDIARGIAAGGDDAARPGGQMELGLLGALFDRRALGLAGGGGRERCSVESDEELALEALTLTWCNLLLEHQVEYADAVSGARQDAVTVTAIMRQYGPQPLCEEAICRLDAEIVGGIAERIRELLEPTGDPLERQRQAA